MISFEDENLLKKYYQANFDFNTSSLSDKETDEIKILAKEKRVNYALAPLGEKIFDFISEQSPDLHFELVDFESSNIDGMLYIPRSGNEKAYIILNGSKPFINQIFAASHEYYHYIRDYELIKEKPYVCCLSSLENINEKRASRFAAEILLPDEALKNEIKNFQKRTGCSDKKENSFEKYALISMFLTIKYQLPLKAVIYRLHEEKYISNVNRFIENYDVIKSVLMQIEIFKNQIDLLYSTNNASIDNNGLIYQQIEKTYKNGLASREEIIKDAANLNLNEDVIRLFFDDIDKSDDENDDSEVAAIIQK